VGVVKIDGKKSSPSRSAPTNEDGSRFFAFVWGGVGVDTRILGFFCYLGSFETLRWSGFDNGERKKLVEVGDLLSWNRIERILMEENPRKQSRRESLKWFGYLEEEPF
ncbi:unnamed protein product, partial [Musa hybrid cultivar]